MFEADPARYGQMWAAVYDELHGHLDPSAAVELMARLAGLRLRERHGDWQRGAFTATSPIHVSIYERA